MLFAYAIDMSKYTVGYQTDLSNSTTRGHLFPEAKVKATTEKTALKSLPTPEDVADQIKTLVLSKSITGQNIVLDGGIAI